MAHAKQKHTPPQTYTDQIQAVVNAVDFVPDVTNVLENADTFAALVEAFIAEHVAADSREELGSAEDRDRDDDAAWQAIRSLIKGTLPDGDLQALGELLGRWTENKSTVAWVREEIVYAVGVEVGRRLGGGQ